MTPVLTRRALIAGGAAVAGSARIWAQAIGDEVLTPEMFGAKGDGVTDDSDAMATLAGAVNIRGGGTVRLRRTTYRVGRQTPSTDDRDPFKPASLLVFHGCRRPLRVLGGGARLRCADGLRYGTFNHDGTVLKHGMPYLGPGASTPYSAMVAATDCTGPVEIADLELDGNLSRLRIGGEYGDSGWQIHALGLALFNNAGSELIRNIHTHHHAQDGLYIDGVDATTADPSVRRMVTNVISQDNGRQGCSIVGGRGYAFDHCRFEWTGRAGLMSAPGAGVDIEAEGKRIRALSFNACDFVDNAGCGMVADSGDTEGVTFTGCRFVGTTDWSAWPNKPGIRFRSCSFVGAMCRTFGDPDPVRATQFVDCSFRDDPRLSPTGRVYGGTNPGHPLADLSDEENVLFSRCRFLATHDAVMPWSTRVIYQDCLMEQRSREGGVPRGTFRGKTVIRANVDLYGSRVVGEVDLNGRLFAHTHF